MDRHTARMITRPAADREPAISATPSTARRGPSCRSKGKIQRGTAGQDESGERAAREEGNWSVLIQTAL